MFHIIKNIKPLENYVLEAEFECGIIKQYDVQQLFEKYPMFNCLKEDKQLFNGVKVDGGGFGISWSDKLDLASEELWDKGIMV